MERDPKGPSSAVGYPFELQRSDLVCLPLDSTLAEASALMLKYHVGDVIIVREQDGKRKPIGIITDRDIALKAATHPLESCKVSAAIHMTVFTANVDDDIFKMIRIMKDNGVTRLPLLRDDGELAG